MGVTAAAAAFAWSLGMLPPTLAEVTDVAWGSPAVVGGLALGAAVLLASIPAAQWTVLRHHGPRAWRWVPVNAVAWGVGILWTFAPSPLVDETTPVPALVGLYGAAGALMALTVALVTGWGLRRILWSGVSGA